ncbi:hypothetical protein U0070_020601, partial [Myodes glareolus]
ARVRDKGGPGGEGAWTTEASTGPPAVSTSPESLNQSLPTEDSLLSEGNVEESYEMYDLRCWCLIIVTWSPSSTGATGLRLAAITVTCNIVWSTMWTWPLFSDPPEDVLLAVIIGPICLIPFLVTLVPPENPSTENYPAAKFQVPETTQKHGNRDKELPFFPTASSSSSLIPRPGRPVLSHEDKLRMHIPVNQKG